MSEPQIPESNPIVPIRLEEFLSIKCFIDNGKGEKLIEENVMKAVLQTPVIDIS